MEIFTLLDELEDILDRSRNLPFSAKTVVNKEEILDLLKEIRLKLPDELKQAKWVKEERQRILVEAQKEADDIVKEAENRIIAMIDEHEITKKAYDQKAKIIEKSREEIEKLTKEIEEKKSGNKTFSVMEKGLDYMIIPAEDNIVEIEEQGDSTYTAGMEDIIMEKSEHGGK